MTGVNLGECFQKAKLLFGKWKSKGPCISLISVVLLVSCAWFKDDDASRDPELNLKTVSLILDMDANETSATEVDLVMVYKNELMKSLMKMKAADYYTMADQIRRDYPEMLKVWHWELTPGQSLHDIPLNLCYREKGPFGAVIFARYLTPGDHRLRVGSETDIHVLLRRRDLCILEQGCDGADQLLPAVGACSGGCGVNPAPQQRVRPLPLPRSPDPLNRSNLPASDVPWGKTIAQFKKQLQHARGK